MQKFSTAERELLRHRFSSYPGTPSNLFLAIRALQHCLFALFSGLAIVPPANAPSPLLYCRAAEIRHTTGRVWSATPRGGAAGMTGVSGEERMNASMGEVCGWKIVMVTIE